MTSSATRSTTTASPPATPPPPATASRQYANTTAAVTYVNRPARDYHLTEGSACLGLGPSWLQPSNAESSISIADASMTEGNGGGWSELHFTMTRTGDTSQDVTGNVTWQDGTATTNVRLQRTSPRIDRSSSPARRPPR